MRPSSTLKYMEKCRIRYISQGTEKFTYITAKFFFQTTEHTGRQSNILLAAARTTLKKKKYMCNQ